MDSKIITVVERWVAQIAEEEIKEKEILPLGESYSLDTLAEPSAVEDERGGSVKDVSKEAPSEDTLLPVEENLSDNDSKTDPVMAAVLLAHGMTEFDLSDDEANPIQKDSVAAENRAERNPADESEGIKSNKLMVNEDAMEEVNENGGGDDDDDCHKEEDVLEAKMETDELEFMIREQDETQDTKDESELPKQESVDSNLQEEENSDGGNPENDRLDGDLVKEPCGRTERLEISTIASQLLEAWSSLKEVYRIPKREQEESRKEPEKQPGIHGHLG